MRAWTAPPVTLWAQLTLRVSPCPLGAMSWSWWGLHTQVSTPWQQESDSYCFLEQILPVATDVSQASGGKYVPALLAWSACSRRAFMSMQCPHMHCACKLQSNLHSCKRKLYSSCFLSCTFCLRKPTLRILQCFTSPSSCTKKC